VDVAASLDEVRERIAAAAARVGRSPDSVRVCAVTKTHPAEVVRAAIAACVDAIGENRVQEAAVKRPSAPGAYAWHLVGPLQRNKAKAALDLFDVVESVDRVEIADRLESLLMPAARILPVFLEVNLVGEASKHGVDPAASADLLDHVLDRCAHLRPDGLMTVPPYHADPERSRPHFAALRELGERLWRDRRLGVPELSMGMSEDFVVAVEEGATWVRLGRVLFGPRRNA
jgi:PLP dependent protein